MGCGMGLIKYLLFIFNFIFALCGLAILVVGVLMHLNLKHFSEVVEQNVIFPSVTLIVVGSIIFVVAFFGCCGAIRESQCMTITFASLLLTILVIQVAVAIYAFVVLSKTEKLDIANGYQQNVFQYYKTRKEDRELVDLIQVNLKCCGVNSYRDFYQLGEGGTIPWSCCDNPENGGKGTCPQEAVRDKQGCAPALETFLKYAGTVLGGVALGIAGVELIGIIFALCLANSIRNTDRRGYRV